MGFFSKKDKKQDIPKIDLAALRSAQASEGTANNAPAGIPRAQLDNEIEALQKHLRQALATNATVKKDWNGKPMLVSGPSIKCEWTDDSGERLVIKGISGKSKPQDLMAAIRMSIGCGVLSFEQTLDSYLYRIDRKGIAVIAERFELTHQSKTIDGTTVISYPESLIETDASLEVRFGSEKVWTLETMEKKKETVGAYYGRRVIEVLQLAPNHFKMRLFVPFEVTFAGKAISDEDKTDYDRIVNRMKSHRRELGDERIYIGQCIDEEFLGDDRDKFVSLATASHMLVAGIPRTGKTKGALSMLHMLADAYPESKWYFFDGKSGQDWDDPAKYLSEWDVAKNKTNNPLTNFAQILDKIYEEYKHRQRLLDILKHEHGISASTLIEYNHAARKLGLELMCRVFFLADEFSYVNKALADSTDIPGSPGFKFATLMKAAPFLGFSVIFISQKLQVTDFDGKFRSLVALKCIYKLSAEDARNMAIPGADNLKIGEFIFTSSDEPPLKYRQIYVGDSPAWSYFKAKKDVLEPLDPNYPFLEKGMSEKTSPGEFFNYLRGIALIKMGYTAHVSDIGVSGRFVKGSFPDGVALGLVDPKTFSDASDVEVLATECASYRKVTLFAPIENMKGKVLEEFLGKVPAHVKLQSNANLRYSADAIFQTGSVSKLLLEALKKPAYLDLLPEALEDIRPPKSETGKAVAASLKQPLVQDAYLDVRYIEKEESTVMRGSLFEAHLKKTIEHLVSGARAHLSGAAFGSSSTGSGDQGRDVVVGLADGRVWIISAKFYSDKTALGVDSIYPIAANLQHESFRDKQVKAFMIKKGGRLTAEAEALAKQCGVDVFDWTEESAIAFFKNEGALTSKTEGAQTETADEHPQEELSLDDWMKI